MAPPESQQARDDRVAQAVGVARWRASTALVAVERGRVPRLRQALRVDDLPARDRALALELANGVERRRITLDRVLLALAKRGELPADPYVRTAVRVGAYQLLFLPRVPPRAAVASAVGLVHAQRPFVNAMLRRLASQVVDRAADPERPSAELALPAGSDGPRALVFATDVLPDPERAPDEFYAVMHGVPAEFVARWTANFGAARARQVASASAGVPGVTLRIDPRRADAAAVRSALAAEGVQVVPQADPRLLRLQAVEATSPFSTRAYHDGLFSVQDPTALAAADAVAVRPGETILDMCAAPGGKASALAEALAGQGAVFAFDRDLVRLVQVQQTRTRLRLESVMHVISDLAQAPAATDAVLVDVPCSNTGVLARRVEARRRPLAPALDELVPQQVALLRAAIARVRPGGRAVYSTCSLEPEENRGVVDVVLAADARVALLREQLTWPEAGSHDGGYFALLRVAAD